MSLVLVAVIILAVVCGMFLHEGAHFAVGYYMGTCTEAGVVVPDHDGLRRFHLAGFYVGHTHRNWWSTVAPLAFIVPWGVLEITYRAGVLGEGVYASAGTACLTAWMGWFLSDLPHLLGWTDPFNEDRKLVPLIKVQPNPEFLSTDGGEGQ